MKTTNQPTVSMRVQTGEFVTAPNDRFTILIHDGLINNTILVEYTNDNIHDVKETDCFSNILPAWEFLKRFDEMGGRSVDVKHFDRDGKVEKVEAFKDSMCYKVRFLF